MQIDDILKNELAFIGKNAKKNPVSLAGSARFALGIANKDYPAMTPLLWNSTYEALDLPERNIRLFGNPNNATEIFSALKADERYIGGDVGVGFKDQVLHLLDEIDPLAERMGAINVVVKTNAGLKGYNTDGVGYAKSLLSAMLLQGKHLEQSTVMLLGAGGTTNAIAFALASLGTKLIILNRTESKAADLASRINSYFQAELAIGGPRSDIAQWIKKVQAVVSIIDDPASPLDKFNALGPIELPATEGNIKRNLAEAVRVLSAASKDLIVSDVMLRSEDTATIAEAKRLGFPVLNGVPMVVNQAIEAFWLVNEPALKERQITKDEVADIIRRNS